MFSLFFITIDNLDECGVQVGGIGVLRSSRLEYPTHGLPMLLANMEGVFIHNNIIDPQNPWSPSSLSSHVIHIGAI
jgi:hypothetical protein